MRHIIIERRSKIAGIAEAQETEKQVRRDSAVEMNHPFNLPIGSNRKKQVSIVEGIGHIQKTKKAEIASYRFSPLARAQHRFKI
jgi:hypothetical protein